MGACCRRRQPPRGAGHPPSPPPCPDGVQSEICTATFQPDAGPSEPREPGAASRGLIKPLTNTWGWWDFPWEATSQNNELVQEKFSLREAGTAGLEEGQSQEHPTHPIPTHPMQTHPIPTHPIPIHPIPTHLSHPNPSHPNSSYPNSSHPNTTHPNPAAQGCM